MDQQTAAFKVRPAAGVVDRVTLDFDGIEMTLNASTVAELVLDKAVREQRLTKFSALMRRAVDERAARPVARRIGDAWDEQGGIYAGIIRGRDLGYDYHVIVADPDRTDITWKDAVDWAKALSIYGHQDFTLPTRSEQALLFANVKELFAEAWYWSSEQSAATSDYAWCQTFNSGYQGSDRKATKLRARAVRRFPIE